MNTINDRLKDFLIKNGISQKEFAEKIGSTQQYVSAVLKNERNIGTNIITRIEKTYPKLDMYWFIKGGSNNIKSEIIYNTNGNGFKEMPDGSFNIKVKTLNHSAFASYIETLENGTVFDDFDESTFNVDKYGKGNYMAFRVKGDSMNGGSIDDTPDGAFVLGREIGKHLWQNGFHKTQYGFVILSKQGVFHKDISDFKDGLINCTSRNKSIEYAQGFSLHLDEVYQIFHVIKRTF